MSSRHVAPDFHGLIGALRIAGVHSTREELLDAVVLARRQQFGRAKNPKAFALLRPNRVLSALAARQREQTYIGIKAVRKITEEAGCFVVRMRRDEKDAGDHAGLINGFDGFRKRLCAERIPCGQKKRERDQRK